MVIGDAVFVNNFGEGPAWLTGSIVDTLGSLSLQVKLTDGRIVRRHIDHVRANFNSPNDLEDEDDDFGQAGEEVDPEVPTPTPTEIPPAPPTTVQPQTPRPTQPNAELRHSTRARKPYYPWG
jgi:hypothetical protein